LNKSLPILSILPEKERSSDTLIRVSAGTSPLTCSVDQEGLDANYDGQYIKLRDAAGTVAFWIDVDNAGTIAPSHGCDRAVEITTVASGMTAAQAATAIYTAIVADAEFDAGQDFSNGMFYVTSHNFVSNAGQGVSSLSVFQIADVQVGATNGGSLSASAKSKLAVLMGLRDNHVDVLNVITAVEAGVGTGSMSAAALKKLKIAIPDKQAFAEIEALY
jgi:hypothetical protein